MAISINQIEALTYKWVKKEVADGAFLASDFLAYMRENAKKIDGGEKITAPVSYPSVDDTTGGYYSGSTTLSTAEKDEITRAEVEWVQVYESFLLSKKDILKNSGSPMRILNLIEQKVQIMKDKLESRLSDDSNGIFSSGNGTSETVVGGLQGIISSSAAYAGLSVGDILLEDGNNGWAAKVDSNSGTDRALSLQLIQKVQNQATQGRKKPKIATCRHNVFDQLWALLQPHQRIMSTASLDKLGHEAEVLNFNGVKYIQDDHMKAQSIYFINPDFLKMYIHKDQDMEVQRFPKLEDQDAIKQRVHCMFNLLCNNRRYQGELADIKVAS